MRDEDDEPDFEAPRHRAPPRNSKAGRWVIAWKEGPEQASLEHGNKICRDCREPAPILHAVGNDMRRTVCGACQGRFNRSRMP